MERSLQIRVSDALYQAAQQFRASARSLISKPDQRGDEYERSQQEARFLNARANNFDALRREIAR